MEEMKSVINSYDLMGLSWNDSQAFAPDGAIVLVTSTLNCNLVMCQAGESIIHCISAGERRLKVQDMPQVIKVVKIRRYTMGKNMPLFLFFHTQFVPQKNVFKKKKLKKINKKKPNKTPKPQTKTTRK